MNKDEVKILVRHRLEQAHTSLDDAKFLLQGNRSSQGIVNRAYYAMFYAVLALLQMIGKVPSKHTGIISLFDTEFVLKGVFQKDLSRWLHKAFELRQVSDYRTVKPISREKAEDTLNNAVRFVEVVEKYLSEYIK